MVNLVWTEISIEDLKDISDYIASDSIHYSKITVDRIYQRVQVLIDHPNAGRIVPEINKKNIRELIEGNYRIIYWIKNSAQVEILRVYHTARFLRRKNLR